MTAATPLVKVPTGVSGLDEITGGGLPLHRPTLICGGAGSGKTLFALTFVLEGALKYGEPGVFISFEENEEELAKNVASLGYDLEKLVADNKLAVDYIHVERNEIEETGEYDLEGLFVRVAHAVRTVGAKRIALDTLEALFAGLSDEALLRAELRRLFRWLKDQKLTAVITAERGESSMTRQGLEEYVSDCVILLDHDVAEQIATRRLRVVKYRGAAHGTNEYPFLIDAEGLCVLPVTSVELAHHVSTERITTGIPGLDEMLGGKGFWRGSSVLVSGVAGTGKTTIASSFVDAACRRGERALYFAFEESRRRSCATCAPSDSTSSNGSTRASSACSRRAPHIPGSRCTCCDCTGKLKLFRPKSWSSTRSIFLARSEASMKSNPCCFDWWII